MPGLTGHRVIVDDQADGEPRLVRQKILSSRTGRGVTVRRPWQPGHQLGCTRWPGLSFPSG